MAQTASPVSGVAQRYARSLFELAQSEGSIAEVEADLGRFDALIKENDDLDRLVRSPVFSADDQYAPFRRSPTRPASRAWSAISCASSARNRRLFALPDMIRAFRAHRCRQPRRGRRRSHLGPCADRSAATGTRRRRSRAWPARTCRSTSTVDPSILGGLVVKVGSRQIDTSLKTKLTSLKLAMKEVG